MRLMDSGTRSQTDSLASWLGARLSSATSLTVQTAYYSDNAFHSIQSDVVRLLTAGGQFCLLLGGNQSTARLDHIKFLIDTVGALPGAELYVIMPSRRGMLVHSKLYHVGKPTGDEAWVGSANFTGFGLATNVEAGIALDQTDGASVAEVKQRLDSWLPPSPAYPRALVPLVDGSLNKLLATGVLTRSRTGEERETGVEEPDPFTTRSTKTGSSSHRGGVPFVSPLRGRRLSSAQKTAAAGRRATALRGQPAQGLPPQVVGTVKRLGKQDLRGLAGERGTAYLSLGLPPAPIFGHGAGAPTSDPFIATAVEARYVVTPKVVAPSLSGARLQWEGRARGTRTHGNARINLPKDLIKDLQQMRPPRYGDLQLHDLVIVEHLVGPPWLARITFVRRQDQAFRWLSPLIGTSPTGAPRPPRGYGWLTQSQVSRLPSW